MRKIFAQLIFLLLDKNSMRESIKVFCSYAHEDEELCDRLEKHLSSLKRNNLIDTWHDRKISPGIEWKGKIDAQMNSAQIILLLISSDFLASDYCYDIELRKALERHNTGEAAVIPIILRPVAWKDTPISKLQALPTDGKPVTSWSNIDDAFLNVVEGIRVSILGLAESNKSEIADGPQDKFKNSLPGQVTQNDNEKERWVLVFSAKFNKANKSKAEAIVQHLRKLSGDSELTLLKIEEGSLKLYLEGSRKGFDTLNSLYEEGKLNKILDFKIEAVRLQYDDLLFFNDIPLITIFGEMRSGKTVYVSVLKNELDKKIATKFGATFVPTDVQSLSHHDDYNKLFDPALSQKTKRENYSKSIIYRFSMKAGTKKNFEMRPIHVACLDKAGESLEEEGFIKHIANSNGLIFLIDPFQIPNLRSLSGLDNAPQTSRIAYPEEAIIRLANLIRFANDIPLNHKIKIPLAFTLSKVDLVLPYLGSSIPVRQNSNHDGFFDLDDFDKANSAMRTLFINCLGHGFEMFLKLHFESYAYFGVSALGDSSTINRENKPLRVADPFLWLLYKLNVIPGKRR